MEHLYAGLQLLTKPTNNIYERNWRAAYFEKVAIENKLSLNRYDTSEFPPLARVLSNICNRDPYQDVIKSAVICIRNEDWYMNPNWSMSRLTNFSWLRSKVEAADLDVAAAIFLVALGASVHGALEVLQKFDRSKLKWRYFHLLEAMIAVEHMAQGQVDDRDATAAARQLAIDHHFT